MNNLQTTHYKRIAIILFFVLLVMLPVYCIEVTPGSGREVSAGPNQDRSREFYYYNTTTDDQHWSGSDKWEVRFDFAAVYPTYANTKFRVNKVKVWFPDPLAINTPIRIELFSSYRNQPIAPLDTITVTATSTTTWTEFVVNPPIEEDTMWVRIFYDTVGNGRYMASSIGDGSHSYYWNNNYYQNMATAGYHSEFFVSVEGNFILNAVDLELSSFNLKPEISLGSIVRPEFALWNNSQADTLKYAKIKLDITNSNTAYSVADTVHIRRWIMPNAEYIVPYTDPAYSAYQYTIPDTPCQIKIKATLHSEYDLTDAIFNNTIIQNFNFFEEDYPRTMVENLLRSVHRDSILVKQHRLITDRQMILNYYPVASDTNFAYGSLQRLNWYGFTGMPMTVFGGDKHITGYSEGSYATLCNSALTDLNLDKTFLTQSDVSLSLPSPYNLLEVDITMRNQMTHIFTEPSFGSQNRFYAALCLKDPVNVIVDSVLVTDNRFYIFNKWGAYNEILQTDYAIDSDNLQQFSINVSDISADSLVEHYAIIYWIQNITTKEILYSNLIPIVNIVSNTDENTPQIPDGLSLSPNPVNIGKDIRVKLPEGYTKSNISYSLYNTKGQLIKRNIPLSSSKSSISTTEIKTAGIYIVRFSITDKTGHSNPTTITKKILLY